jgi:hypothetical protein
VEPEDAIGPGPFIYIALPAGETRFGRGSGQLPDLIPVNATRLLHEWEAQLDPIIALRARRMLRVVPDWVIGDTFVEPTTMTMFLVREAAAATEVQEAYASSGGRLTVPGENRSKGISDFVSDAGLDNTALPIFLGLAVTAAFLHPIGFRARQARMGF